MKSGIKKWPKGFQNLLLSALGVWCLVSVCTLIFIVSNIHLLQYHYEGDSASTNIVLTKSRNFALDYQNMSVRPRVRKTPVPLVGCAFSGDKLWRRNPNYEDFSITSQVWVKTDVATGMFVYSAYYDDNDVDDENNTVPIIRIIGVGTRSTQHHPICVVQWSVNSTCLEERQARVEILPENKNKRYTALFVICNISDSDRRNPYAVSIIGENSTYLENRLLVKYPEPLRYNLTVCFPVIHSEYNDETESIQTMEVDQVLGVENFVVYNLSIGTRVQAVLNYYRNQGILDVKAWNMPVTDIHYFGQLAVINDCIYSNRGRSKYIIVKDLDEFLVPYKDKTLPRLINSMLTHKPKTGVILFRHSYFRLYWPDDVAKFKDGQRAKQLQLYTLLKVWREKYVWIPTRRMKYIVLPTRVRVGGIHFVWNLIKGFEKCIVEAKQGLLHHYTRSSKYTYHNKGKVKEVFFRLLSGQLLDRYNRTYSLIHRQPIATNA